MTHEKFIKLCQGTDDDFAIACNWLVHHHDPIEYIKEHGTVNSDSPVCTKSISWCNYDWNDRYRLGTCIYYKYKEWRYIVRCEFGMTVTDRNYDDSARVINH